MRHKWLAWGLLFAAYLGAFAANVGHFWWSYDAGWPQILASVGYMIVWGWFLISGYRDPKKLRVTMAAGILTTIGGILGLLARTFGTGILTILGLIFAGSAITPLYGLLSTMEDYDLLYLTAVAFGAVWTIISCCMKKVQERKGTR